MSCVGSTDLARVLVPWDHSTRGGNRRSCDRSPRDARRPARCRPGHGRGDPRRARREVRRARGAAAGNGRRAHGACLGRDHRLPPRSRLAACRRCSGCGRGVAWRSQPAPHGVAAGRSGRARDRRPPRGCGRRRGAAGCRSGPAPRIRICPGTPAGGLCRDRAGRETRTPRPSSMRRDARPASHCI